MGTEARLSKPLAEPDHLWKAIEDSLTCVHTLIRYHCEGKALHQKQSGKDMLTHLMCKLPLTGQWSHQAELET